MPIRSKPKALKNARLRQCGLSENEFYQFSLSHTLSIYPLNATYTFIPKNACSTLRYSIAVANGFLRHDDDVNWIHANNGSFVASQKESACADYSFVVLRCPFRRLVSCFLDKFVRGNLDFRDETGAVLDFSFSDFLTFIESQERSAMDHHWRNQTDFLHYEEYDDYFCLERFDEAIQTLSKQGLKVIDSRLLLQHDTTGFKKKDGAFSQLPISELKKMSEAGFLPEFHALYDSRTVGLVKEVYSDDLSLFKEKFGPELLLFE